MGYSCTDFVDSVLDALGIELPDEAMDDPACQADLVLERLDEMANVLSACRAYLSMDTVTRIDPAHVRNLIDHIDALLSPMAQD